MNQLKIGLRPYLYQSYKLSNNLGEVNINFGDPVLISDQPIVYTNPRRGGKTYYPQFNPKYYTGWYKIEVAPGQPHQNFY